MGKSEKYKLGEFRCARCGNCCKGDGIVIITDKEIWAAAKLLGLPVEDFWRRYTRESEFGERWLVDKFVEEERWCVFLERDEQGSFGCAIQKAKPEQCSNFPYKWRTRDMLGQCQGMKE